jgi:hypothetical protein
MRRRDFITLLGGAAAVYPLIARAQQPARMSRIGWIAIGTPQGSEFFEAVREGLRQLDFNAHPPNQCPQICRDLRPASQVPRFPTPIAAETDTVPAHAGLGPEGRDGLED